MITSKFNEGGLRKLVALFTKDGNFVVKLEVTAGSDVKRTVTSHSEFYSFGRKTFDELQLGTGFVSRQFHYHMGEVAEEYRANDKVKSAATTQLVSQITYSDGRTISYEYDAEERITKVIDSADGTTEYTYDALGQLLTETVNGELENTMTYDNYGNIRTRNGVSYTYGNSSWKDLLTRYDGKSITYDAQGNPKSYLGHTLTWEKGRQLKKFVKSGGTTVTYAYNANGIRTNKTVGSVEHTYILDGTKILRETWDDNTLIPMYDNEDSVCGISYNDVPFYFQKNLQGDVIAILNQNAEVVARYTYDAWGVCTVESDTSGCGIAEINPYRYRSYYYDVETGLYYLQSRYYDAGVGRFINADDAVYIGLAGTMSEYNLNVYCANNPINRYDPTGYYAMELVFSSSMLATMSGALSGIMGGIITSLAGMKTAITASWCVPVCIAAVAIAVVGIIHVIKRVVALMVSADQVISAVKSKVKFGGCNPNKLNNYTVYVIVKKNTTDVVYVGMTKNYSNRKRQHTSPGKRFPESSYTMLPVETGLSKRQARALEQTIITAYTLKTLVNMINSISPLKWREFNEEFKQMETLIQSWIDPE